MARRTSTRFLPSRENTLPATSQGNGCTEVAVAVLPAEVAAVFLLTPDFLSAAAAASVPTRRGRAAAPNIQGHCGPCVEVDAAVICAVGAANLIKVSSGRRVKGESESAAASLPNSGNLDESPSTATNLPRMMPSRGLLSALCKSAAYVPGFAAPRPLDRWMGRPPLAMLAA